METHATLPFRRLPGHRRVFLYVAIGFYCLPTSAWASEATLRVAFVYNFIKFITWPPSLSPRFRLCALGANGETQTALLQLNGKQINKQTIDVLYFEDQTAITAQIAACHLVYRPTSAAPMFLPHPLPPGVVLVADDPPITDAEVSIALIRGPEGRIEFDINPLAITQAGVDVSSQLQKLARNGRRGKDE